MPFICYTIIDGICQKRIFGYDTGLNFPRQAEMDMQSEDICPKKEGMPWQDHAREEEFAESRPARFLGRRERKRIVWS